MKKITSFLLIVFLLAIFVATPVSAATSAGIKPNSFLYFLDTTFEKVNLFFTFNPEKKAKKALEYADERLAEAETLIDNKDSNMVKAVMENYTANIILATEKSKEVKDQQVLENLFNTISDNASKNQEVLNNVLTKVPEEAKDAILKAIEASKKEREEAINQIAQLKGEVEKLKKEVAELKQREKEAAKQVSGIESEIEMEVESKKEQQKKSQQDDKEVSSKEVVSPEVENKNNTSQSSEIERLKLEIAKAKDEAEKNEQNDLLTPTIAPPLTPTCNSGAHIENGVCASNIASCSITNGIGEKKWDGSSWGNCQVISCNSGFEKSSNACSKTSAQVELFEILLVKVVPNKQSVFIEWETNLPSSSKIFLSKNGIKSVFNSESGWSANHLVNISQLLPETLYSFEIEAVRSDSPIKKSGNFTTLRLYDAPLTAIMTFHPNLPNKENLFMYSLYSGDCQGGVPLSCLGNNAPDSVFIDGLKIGFQDTLESLTDENYSQHGWKTGEKVILKSFTSQIIGLDIDNELSEIKFLVNGVAKPVVRNGNSFAFTGSVELIGNDLAIAVWAKINPIAIGENLQIKFDSLELEGETTNLPIAIPFILPQQGRKFTIL